MDSVAIRSPEDVANDAREMMREMKESRDWGFDALPRLMENLNEQVYQLEMSLAEHKDKKHTLGALRAISTCIGLMTEVCD